MKKYIPYKTINGRKDRVSRHVMADHIGRALLPMEHVYHVNGDPKDNNIETLILIKKESRK